MLVDSVVEEFRWATEGIPCLCSMMSGASAGKDSTVKGDLKG